MHYISIIWVSILFFYSPVIFSQGLLNHKAFLIQTNGNIVTQHHFTNYGKFTQSGGSFVFAGNGDLQKLKGDSSVAFNKLHIASGSNTVLESGGHTILSTLKSDGLLNANNKITLLSTINASAAVDGSGLGEITGNLTMQSYFANGYGYKYLGAPFQSLSVNDFASYVNLNASFPSVYQYSENILSNGWVNYMYPSNLLEPMKGYAFQFGNNNSPRTVSINGVVNNGAITLNLINNNKIYTKGFHLISNPYPSPINWDGPLGWTKLNMDNAIYYFDTDEQSIYTGVYNTYINGISSNGLANNFIPAMQSFFVRVSDGDYPVLGNLSINNQARLNHITQPYRKINSTNDFNYLRLAVRLSGKKIADPLVIYFTENATSAFNNRMDAIKLMNTSDHVPSLYSLKNDGNLLSIQSLPKIALSVKVPIGIVVKTSGEYIFANTNPFSLPTGIYCYLYDALSKKYIDLKENNEYKIQLSAGEYNQQFFVVFSKFPISNTVTVDPNSLLNEFTVQVVQKQVFVILPMINGNTQTIQVTNLLGQKIFSKSVTQSGKHLLDYPFISGVYIITVWDNLNSSSKKILIAN